MRISDWSSDVCSSDLQAPGGVVGGRPPGLEFARGVDVLALGVDGAAEFVADQRAEAAVVAGGVLRHVQHRRLQHRGADDQAVVGHRSEEHTSELQSLMRISYAVFCLKKKKVTNQLK